MTSQGKTIPSKPTTTRRGEKGKGKGKGREKKRGKKGREEEKEGDSPKTVSKNPTSSLQSLCTPCCLSGKKKLFLE